MQLLTTAAEVQNTLAEQRNIILIPTMGGLHDGHLALVKKARQIGGKVVVSIYVNPLQFGIGEDFADYPRRLAADCDKLRDLADIVYAPNDSEIYPEEQTVRIALPPIADELCGASRPGFFYGVAVVVCKLFNQIRPTIAVFGAKDYQQAFIIRLLVKQLAMATTIITHPTVRETDGLALSSRNDYLTAHERKIAPTLYAVLQQMAKMINNGCHDYSTICQTAIAAINATEMKCDYFVARDAETLGSPQNDKNIVLLTAAQLGRARLIDNCTLYR